MNALLACSRLARFAFGFVLVLLIAWAGFRVTLNLLRGYGATAEERAAVLPGDELYPNAPIRWRHAITIDAPPQETWQWIIQMGDTRAAFYSYMFIERLFDPTPGRYVNAAKVHEEWQNPQIGLAIIQEAMNIVEWEKERYLLASAPTGGAVPLGWTWLWHIQPAAGGQTRLNIHMHIQPPGEMGAPILTDIIELGAFIMERNMMTGLKVRAEGGGEPAWIEPAEIAIWLAALLVGLAAAGRFVAGPLDRRGWSALALGLAALVVLFVFTFLQPAVWLRAALDLALAGGLAWVLRRVPRRAAG